jgi:hypothetical protein
MVTGEQCIKRLWSLIKPALSAASKTHATVLLVIVQQA